MPHYKLPKCWLGHPVEDLVESISNESEKKKITKDMVNMDCHCHHPLQAHFCMEGHMTECHVGMSCAQAKCSHYHGGE